MVWFEAIALLKAVFKIELTQWNCFLRLKFSQQAFWTHLNEHQVFGGIFSAGYTESVATPELYHRPRKIGCKSFTPFPQ